MACAGAPDDSAGYTFTYSPPLNCALPAGTFNVTPSGGEFGLQGSGSYTATPGSTINATFTYVAIDPGSPPPVEMHKVNLQITCPTGFTTGTLSE